ncbi:hypothetical protein LPJ64_001551 [Coemansia asiatica]|uniref:VPS9 domain-containing protein n=1 Tax=Coemansia asiatica TaxID=1052880 RepID=A0A9W7XPS8_9FUNG|nr:hypothetical protein LPJ64_001551 [Coemansia asiatica]KAJ2878743.1 hypothetical protein FB639_003289 [Coemansia asiatica]
MFSRSLNSRQQTQNQQQQKGGVRRATVARSDPLSATTADEADVVGAINRLEPASDAATGYGQHAMLREIRPSSVQPAQATPGADGEIVRTGSFPSTGFSRSRKTSRTISGSNSNSNSIKTETAKETDDVAVLLGAESLGLRMWRYFQTSEEMADVRDMLGNSDTGLVLLPQATRNRMQPEDLGSLLNDNVLFTEQALGDQQAVRFTTVSGICGTVDRGSVAALGMLPPMEDMMQAVSATDSPRATLFDVLGKEIMGVTPLVRLRTVDVRQRRLPDGRMVLVAVTDVPLDRGLVVDSAVTTLSGRVSAQIDATFAALVPQAPTAITDSETVSVAIERIMQLAHAIELRAHQPASGADSGPFTWIAGRQKSQKADRVDIDGDAAQWQSHVAEFQDQVLGYLDALEQETSMCGDSESRRRICVALVECVEKLVTEAVYLRVFAPWSSDDRAQDEAFAAKVAALNVAGIGLDHLGLKSSSESRRDLLRICAETGELLGRMDRVRSPAEKLKLIVDAHRLVVDRMDRLNEKIRASAATGSKSTAPDLLSADGILPLLIYSVVRANPPRFISNLRFVQRFRTHALLASQFEYCLTNIDAVASFVQSVDARKAVGLPAASNVVDRAVVTPALNALHNLLVNNVVSSVGIDVVQGVADGSKKVAVGVFDATVGKLLDSGPLIFRAPWRTASEDKELENRGVDGRDDKTKSVSRVDGDDPRVISGVRSALSSASEQLSHEIRGHLPDETRNGLPRAHLRNAPKPAVIDRFLAMHAGELTINDVSQLLASYKELASYLEK